MGNGRPYDVRCRWRIGRAEVATGARVGESVGDEGRVDAGWLKGRPVCVAARIAWRVTQGASVMRWTAPRSVRREKA